MPIKYVRGDLLWGHDDVIVHGCNCFHKMNKGIAKQIRFAYPGAYIEDLKTMLGDEKKLGTFSQWSGRHFMHDRAITVINAYVQYDYGNRGKHLIDSALESAMRLVDSTIDISKTIGLPKIGAGLGGGDWQQIEPIIMRSFPSRTVTVYELRD